MENQILISAFGPDKPGLVEALSDVVLKCSCNVADSRMAVLGDHFSVLMLVSGKAQNLAKFESEVKKDKDLVVELKKVHERKVKAGVFVYAVKIIGEDTKGLVHEITAYYKAQGVNVLNMDTALTHAPVSGMPMFSMTMQVEVPRDANLRAFKEGLGALCDRLNLDVEIDQIVA